MTRALDPAAPSPPLAEATAQQARAAAAHRAADVAFNVANRAAQAAWHRVAAAYLELLDANATLHAAQAAAEQHP